MPRRCSRLVGVYSQMGYRVLLLSAPDRRGNRSAAAGVEEPAASVVTGQSGVGKSSLLNAVDPTLELKVRAVSAENQKGTHTTTTARLCRWPAGATWSIRRASGSSSFGT